MFFGLLLIIIGLFLMFWGAHYFGVLVPKPVGDSGKEPPAGGSSTP